MRDKEKGVKIKKSLWRHLKPTESYETVLHFSQSWLDESDQYLTPGALLMSASC